MTQPPLHHPIHIDQPPLPPTDPIRPDPLHTALDQLGAPLLPYASGLPAERVLEALDPRERAAEYLSKLAVDRKHELDADRKHERERMPEPDAEALKLIDEAEARRQRLEQAVADQRHLRPQIKAIFDKYGVDESSLSAGPTSLELAPDEAYTLALDGLARAEADYYSGADQPLGEQADDRRLVAAAATLWASRVRPANDEAFKNKLEAVLRPAYMRHFRDQMHRSGRTVSEFEIFELATRQLAETARRSANAPQFLELTTSERLYGDRGLAAALEVAVSEHQQKIAETVKDAALATGRAINGFSEGSVPLTDGSSGLLEVSDDSAGSIELAVDAGSADAIHLIGTMAQLAESVLNAEERQIVLDIYNHIYDSVMRHTIDRNGSIVISTSDDSNVKKRLDDTGMPYGAMRVHYMTTVLEGAVAALAQNYAKQDDFDLAEALLSSSRRAGIISDTAYSASHMIIDPLYLDYLKQAQRDLAHARPLLRSRANEAQTTTEQGFKMVIDDIALHQLYDALIDTHNNWHTVSDIIATMHDQTEVLALRSQVWPPELEGAANINDLVAQYRLDYYRKSAQGQDTSIEEAFVSAVRDIQHTAGEFADVAVQQQMGNLKYHPRNNPEPHDSLRELLMLGNPRLAAQANRTRRQYAQAYDNAVEELLAAARNAAAAGHSVPATEKQLHIEALGHLQSKITEKRLQADTRLGTAKRLIGWAYEARIASFPPGQFAVLAGSFAAGMGAEYVVALSNLATHGPGALVGGLLVALASPIVGNVLGRALAKTASQYKGTQAGDQLGRIIADYRSGAVADPTAELNAEVQMLVREAAHRYNYDARLVGFAAVFGVAGANVAHLASTVVE